MRNNNVDSALRVLKRKMLLAGVIQEHKRRKFYEKKSDKRKRQKLEAGKQIRRTERKINASLFS